MFGKFSPFLPNIGKCFPLAFRPGAGRVRCVARGQPRETRFERFGSSPAAGSSVEVLRVIRENSPAFDTGSRVIPHPPHNHFRFVRRTSFPKGKAGRGVPAEPPVPPFREARFLVLRRGTGQGNAYLGKGFGAAGKAGDEALAKRIRDIGLTVTRQWMATHGVKHKPRPGRRKRTCRFRKGISS